MGEPAKVAVKLKRAHDHEGEPKLPGDSILVYPDQAEWLVSAGIADRSVTEAPKAKARDSK